MVAIRVSEATASCGLRRVCTRLLAYFAPESEGRGGSLRPSGGCFAGVRAQPMKRTVVRLSVSSLSVTSLSQSTEIVNE